MINNLQLKNTTAENVPALLCSYLSSSKVQPIIIIVDAINQVANKFSFQSLNIFYLMDLIQLEDCGDFKTFQWIPAKLSPNVRCIFSLINNSIPHQELVKREPKPQEMKVNSLDFDTKKVKHNMRCSDNPAKNC